MRSIFGLDVVISPDHPKRKLPDEVIPGVVPWPPGFKEDMDAWLLGFFGTNNIVKDGEVLKMGRAVCMSPRTLDRLKAQLAKEHK